MPEPQFKKGDLVEKTKGDYYFEGIVVAVIEKVIHPFDRPIPSGQIRYAVQNPAGMIHIFHETQLERHSA